MRIVNILKKAVLHMMWLVVVHVVSAVLALGPAFAFPWVLRPTSSAAEMASCLDLVDRLEVFPKIFGTLALLSGVALVIFGSYGSFAQVWIAGSLLLFAAVQVLVIALMTPAAKKLRASLAEAGETMQREASAAGCALYARVRRYHAAAGVLSFLILLLMIVKPR
ncbi:DUF2269 family protein [Paenibacillus sp.]|uniref:DUF2269 family protein n=1 Tax=Paenibacillus sp. TaxID=58172 RepID=UPI002D336C1C|nr:DUF2269 family protein [Paenibacillus sp.]HZG84793.1 DUF2269 family protein [Paenibacillus sp.]